MFSAFLHSHLAGRKLRLRHIRDGRELDPIAVDEHYDYDYQISRAVDPSKVILLPGDEFILECEYDTSERDAMTFGGGAASNEMCLAFLSVYPRSKLAGCFHMIGLGTALEASRMPWTFGAYEYGKTEAVVHDALVKQAEEEIDWSDANFVKHFQNKRRFGNAYHLCTERSIELITEVLN